MSNSLDPDQARRIVGPDLGPNCLPRLSADNTGTQRVNDGSYQKYISLNMHQGENLSKNMLWVLIVQK